MGTKPGTIRGIPRELRHTEAIHAPPLAASLLGMLSLGNCHDRNDQMSSSTSVVIGEYLHKDESAIEGHCSLGAALLRGNIAPICV